jgi:hypothetical protein
MKNEEVKGLLKKENNEFKEFLINNEKKEIISFRKIYFLFSLFVFILALLITASILILFAFLRSGPIMFAFPNQINRSSYVKLIWEKIESPTKEDWIGVYSPKQEDDSSPLMKILLINNNLNGTGETTIRLPNIREDYDIRYFSKNNKKKLSKIITVHKDYPNQGFL